MDSHEELTFHTVEIAGVKFGIQRDERWWSTREGRKERAELLEYMEKLKAREEETSLQQ